MKPVEEEVKPKKKDKDNKVTLSKVSRNKKKFISSVKGLDKFSKKILYKAKFLKYFEFSILISG